MEVNYLNEFIQLKQQKTKNNNVNTQKSHDLNQVDLIRKTLVPPN